MQKYWVTVDDKGNTRWYKDAKCTILHRENGPAVEWAGGTKSWYQNGQRHRIDGPAIEQSDGIKEWWINGKKLTEDEFSQRVKNV